MGLCCGIVDSVATLECNSYKFESLQAGYFTKETVHNGYKIFVKSCVH